MSFEIWLVYRCVWNYSKSSYGQTSHDWSGGGEKKEVKWNSNISMGELFRRLEGDFVTGKNWDENDTNHCIEINSIKLKGLGGAIEINIVPQVIKLPLN